MSTSQVRRQIDFKIKCLIELFILALTLEKYNYQHSDKRKASSDSLLKWFVGYFFRSLYKNLIKLLGSRNFEFCPTSCDQTKI